MRPAFTLIEILVVISIILALVGLGVPAYQSIRLSSQKAEARQTVGHLTQAILLYRGADAMNRFPPETADLSLRRTVAGVAGIEDLLEDTGVPLGGKGRHDDQGRLLDPWTSPYLYQLSARPAPVAGTAVMNTWNWDATAGHELAWGRRVIDGVAGTGAFPFPYVWSLGPAKSSEDATTWIFTITAVEQP